MYVFCSKSHQQEVVASVMESRPVLGPVLLSAYSSGKTPTFTPTGVPSLFQKQQHLSNVIHSSEFKRQA